MAHVSLINKLDFPLYFIVSAKAAAAAAGQSGVRGGENTGGRDYAHFSCRTGSRAITAPVGIIRDIRFRTTKTVWLLFARLGENVAKILRRDISVKRNQDTALTLTRYGRHVSRELLGTTFEDMPRTVETSW